MHMYTGHSINIIGQKHMAWFKRLCTIDKSSADLTQLAGISQAYYHVILMFTE